jgi:hypothetical protein
MIEKLCLILAIMGTLKVVVDFPFALGVYSINPKPPANFFDWLILPSPSSFLFGLGLMIGGGLAYRKLVRRRQREARVRDGFE